MARTPRRSTAARSVVESGSVPFKEEDAADRWASHVSETRRDESCCRSGYRGLGLDYGPRKKKEKETRRACAAGFGCWAGRHSTGLRRREQADWARSQAERKFPFSFYFPSF